MLVTWLLSSSLAATLVVDAKVPAEILISGLPVARLYHPSLLELAVEPGPAQITVKTTGVPLTYRVEILPEGETLLVIGKSGVTTGQRLSEAPLVGDAPARVELRAAAGARVTVRVGVERYLVTSDAPVVLDLPPGDHEIVLTNADGTMVWAHGVLAVAPGGAVVLQAAEGRMPEVSGATFRPGPR